MINAERRCLAASANKSAPLAPDEKPKFSPRVLLFTVGLGLLIAIVDVHVTSDQVHNSWVKDMDNPYMVAAGLLGLWQPRTFWLSAGILTLSLCAVHVIAILCGVRHPYVEPSIADASACLFIILPTSISALAGATVRWIWNLKMAA